MMRNWRDSFVGSTLKGSFESSISGGKLKDLINLVLQVDNAYMHATTAADHVSFTATAQDWCYVKRGVGGLEVGIS